MTDRMTREEDWGYGSFTLANAESAVKGEMACIDTSTGTVKAGQTSTTLLPIGYFDETLTGDGTKKVRIKFFRELRLHWWNNDGVAPLAGGDIGNECYIKDSKTVSQSSSGSTRSKAGRVWAISTTYGVLVEAGPAVTGPTGTGISDNGTVADRTALKAITAANRYDGMLVLVRTDNSLWRFNSAASFTSDENEQLGCTPGAGTGRWVRADKTFVMKLPFTKDTADATALCTLPTGFALRLIGMPFWDVVTGFTGGTNSAIGVSASAIATTKGDLLGGASGQLTAVLGTAGIKAGTIGPLIDTLAEIQAFFLKAADFIRADLIASQYTAGAGYVCIPVAIELVG